MKLGMFLHSGCLFLAAVLTLGVPPANGQTAKALLLFGGRDHKTFLGCLNCVATNSNSVCNKYGAFGSKYESDSLWNRYGEFGSKYEDHSPWNKYTDEAPIIVDRDGGSYGYFSLNKYHHDRTQIGWLVAILDYQDSEDDLDKTRDKMCGD